MVRTRRLILLQYHEDGVFVVSRHRYTIDGAVRASTRRVRQFRDGMCATQVQQVDVLFHELFTREAHERSDGTL